ncbi:MBL fold metallo-hydrolase [Flavobacterium sp.]|uniref:MBL fold metallo-hydrolase n=1 Tax=Flavobacterium sp. TaxID=239 RepID=UPI00120A3410|nr:MBL fold metallo-hydrolase [Flavobacterium sp.]RZJ72038.1 MAG: MBL fold metallo-hydrolase [Flavobacterium sp.]
MQIFVLKEGDFSVSKNKEFYGIDDFPGGLRMAVQAFLVVTTQDVILLDAGFGLSSEDGKPKILSLLENHDFAAEQVTKILISHFHKDHVNGLGRFESGNFIGNFPNAKIYFQQRELDWAFAQQDNPSFDFGILDAISKLPNLVDLDSDEGQIGNQITFAVSGGHTSFHQEFWIRESEETIFYGADNLPQKSYIDFHIAYKSDHDGKKASELRQIWKKQAEAEHWKILLFHDMQIPILEF